MKHVIFLLLLSIFTTLRATERISVLIDQPSYLAGERLNLSVRVEQSQPDIQPSRIAYVEFTDTRHLCAQAMVWLDAEGCGWGTIALPQSLHSGHYLLSAYTQAMRADADAQPWQQLVPVVNILHVTRDDDVTFYPADSLDSASAAQAQTRLQWSAGAEVRIDLPAEARHARLATVSLIGQCITTDEVTLAPTPTEKLPTAVPEIEGHQVQVRVVGQHDVRECTLATVGKAINIYAGQRQPDDTWTFYTDHLCGTLPMALTAVNAEGNNVPMDFVSPYARLLPGQLPPLTVRCQPEQLRARSLGAQQQQAITVSLPTDTLPFSATFMGVEPAYTYVMDEWARFSTIREIITEFVHGAHHGRDAGRHCLYIFDPDMGFVSSWPAMILLDGVPVYDTEKILDYDARLLQYVHIYQGRFVFGGQMCYGVISFTTQRGRLSNYKLDAGTRLVNYSFPQDHPSFIGYQGQSVGTLYWNPAPSLTSPEALQAPSAPGIYTLRLQWVGSDGEVRHQNSLIEVR